MDDGGRGEGLRAHRRGRRGAQRQLNGEAGPLRTRTVRRSALIALAVLLLPLPWRAAPPSSGPGTAWRVDGRLLIDEAVVDPPGETLWLAAGRPQLLVERALERATGSERGVALTRGEPGTTPAAAVPAAVAATLLALGDADAGAESARIALHLGPVDLGRFGGRLHLGDSNGLAVAVAVLRSRDRLAVPGEVVAATGRVAPDGTVGAVGGIAPKVRAAVRAGARTVLVPHGQVEAAQGALGTSDVVVIGVADVRELIGPTPP